MELAELLARLKGQDPQAEEEQKKKADKGIATFEQETGTKFEDEDGVEPDEVTEAIVTLPFGGPASGMARRAGGFAVKQAEKVAAKSALDKLREQGQPKPLYSDVAKGSGNSKEFHDFIRPEDPKTSVTTSSIKQPRIKKETLQVPRNEVDPRVKVLQEEQHSLNLRTPEGRTRHKEISDLIKNRHYHKE